MGWIDSPGAWSLLFNHNPAAAQTGRENVPAPPPPLLLELPEETRVGRLMLVFIPRPFPRWLRRGVSSYPLRQRPRFSHWEKRTGQRPAHFSGLSSNSKKPERRRTQGVHISGTTSWGSWKHGALGLQQKPRFTTPVTLADSVVWVKSQTQHQVRVETSAQGFLDLHTIDIWGRIIPYAGRGCLCTVGCSPASLTSTH